MSDYKAAGLAYVRGVIDQMGLNGAQLAKLAQVRASTINRPLNNPEHKYGFSTRTLVSVAHATGIPLPPELGGSPANGSHVRDPRAYAKTPTRFPIVGGHAPAIDLPLMGHYDAGANIMVYTEDEASPYIERPAFLLADTRAYASLIADDLMSPVYESGHTVYLSPSRPITQGDDVLIIFRDKTGFVRRFLRREHGAAVFCQFSPKEELTFPSDDIEEMHLVIASLRFRR
jgi:SOS-response transcriptional repressor LexA